MKPLRLLWAFIWRYCLGFLALAFVVNLLPHKLVAWLESDKIAPWGAPLSFIAGLVIGVVWPVYVLKRLLAKD